MSVVYPYSVEDQEKVNALLVKAEYDFLEALIKFLRPQDFPQDVLDEMESYGNTFQHCQVRAYNVASHTPCPSTSNL